MGNYKKLIKNTKIFAIANFGSKILTILLVPFYTHVLSTTEFGKVDMIINIITLLLPIISMSIFEAILRFVMDKTNEKDEIFSSGIIIIIGGMIFSGIIALLINLSPQFGEYSIYIWLLLNFQAINQAFSQFIRATGRVKLFAVNGVLNTLTLLLANIILLAILNLGIKGYLLSMILSNIICSINILLVGQIWKEFNWKKVNKRIIKEMLKYSIPLIPNSIMWWMMNLIDRYLIVWILGLNYNGIYAIANKIPSFLKIFHSIFSQAWQLAAIEEANSINKGEFYTKIFESYASCLCIIISVILVPLKLIIILAFSDNYTEAWKSIPFLLVAVMFSSFSGFLGTNYIAMRKTKGVFKTSLVGALSNLILNLICIPKLGLVGAAIATMISFGIVWILRIKETKSFIAINFKKNKLIKSLGVIGLQTIILFLGLDIKLEIFMLGILMYVVYKINFEDFRFILQVNKSKERNESSYKLTDYKGAQHEPSIKK